MTRSLPSSYATGNQVPTSFVIPEWDTNDVLDTLDLLAEAGFECMDWQGFLLEAWMGIQPNGRWSAPIVGNETSRQQGKTRCIQGRSAAEMLFYTGTVIYTAQLQKTSTETFEEMAQLMDTKKLRKYLTRNGIRTALGREEIRLKSGAKMKFLARTRNGGNGQHGSLLIFDEAQYLEPQSQGSFLGAISACRTVRGPQTIYNGNAPEEADYALVFERIRSDALSGNTKRTAWTEWSCGDTKEPPEDIDDRELWKRCNPSWGILLQPDTAESEFESLEPVQFAHQRLGWFKQRDGADNLFTAEEWDALEVEDAPDTWERLTYGIRFRPDGKSVALSVCVVNGDRMHIELIREELMALGIEWLVEFIALRARESAAIVIDGKSDVEDLRQRLIKKKVPKNRIVAGSPATAASAAGMFLNAVRDGSLSHVADKVLRDAVLEAQKRKIGEGFGFDGQCVERIDSCALAIYGAKTTKRNPVKKGRVGC